MFAPPEIVHAEVFARLPDKYRRNDMGSDWLQKQLKNIGPGFPTHSFLEGPSFDRDGNLYCVDIPYGRIFRISPAGEFELAAEYDGNPNGLKIHRDGRIFIADNRRGVMLMDPASGAIEPFCDQLAMEGFKGLNDLVFASNGDLFFTDMGQTGLHDPTGCVYRLQPDGSHDLLLNNVPGPNGIVLNGNETALYVAATRLNAVWVCPLSRGDMPSKVGTFIYLNGGMGPDGLALDAEGNLAVCHVGFGAVWLFSPRGEPLLRIEPPEGRFTSNLAYGGVDNKSLYITESSTGSILKVEMAVPGKEMFSHT